LHLGKLLGFQSGKERRPGLGNIVMGKSVMPFPAQRHSVGDDMPEPGVGLFAVNVVGFEVAAAPVTGPASHDALVPVPQEHRRAPLRIRPPVTLPPLSYGA
jgi:hypothetical protein